MLDNVEQSNPNGAIQSTVPTLRVPLALLDLKPKQGPRPDDETVHHQAFSFGGKRRRFRPDSLLISRWYIPTRDLQPSSFFEWDGKNSPASEWSRNSTTSLTFSCTRTQRIQLTKIQHKIQDIWKITTGSGLKHWGILEPIATFAGSRSPTSCWKAFTTHQSTACTAHRTLIRRHHLPPCLQLFR